MQSFWLILEGDEYRTVIKLRDVPKERTVTKECQETRYKKVTLLDYLLRAKRGEYSEEVVSDKRKYIDDAFYAAYWLPRGPCTSTSTSSTRESQCDSKSQNS